MTEGELEGTQLPSGEYTVEGWKAHLWADATRTDDDAFRYEDEAPPGIGQLVPYSMCQHVAFEGTGGVEETMGRLSEDWTEGAALGQLRAEFYQPIEVDERYSVSAHVSNVKEKEGSSGPLTIVTVAYEITTSANDELVYEMEADMVLMEGL